MASAQVTNEPPILFADFVLEDNVPKLDVTSEFIEVLQQSNDFESNSVAFLGPTHSGKSQLLQSILQLHGYKPGSVSIATPKSFTGTSAGVIATRFHLNGQMRVSALDCEGEGASSLPSAHGGDKELWNEESREQRNQLVEQFLPRVMYCVADVIVLVCTDHPANHASMDKAISFAARSINQVESFVPNLVLVFNKCDVISSNATEEILKTHAKPAAQLRKCFQSIRVVLVPNFNDAGMQEPYDQQVRSLSNTITELLLQSRRQRLAAGCLLKEQLWMKIFASIISSDPDPFKLISITGYLASVMYPKEDHNDIVDNCASLFRTCFESIGANAEDIRQICRLLGNLLALDKDHMREAVQPDVVDAEARRQGWQNSVVERGLALLRQVTTYELCVATFETSACSKIHQLHGENHIPKMAAETAATPVPEPATTVSWGSMRTFVKQAAHAVAAAVTALFVRPPSWPGEFESGFGRAAFNQLLNPNLTLQQRPTQDPLRDIWNTFNSYDIELQSQPRDHVHANALAQRLSIITDILPRSFVKSTYNETTCLLCLNFYQFGQSAPLIANPAHCGHFCCQTCFDYLHKLDELSHKNTNFQLPCFCPICAKSTF